MTRQYRIGLGLAGIFIAFIIFERCHDTIMTSTFVASKTQVSHVTKQSHPKGNIASTTSNRKGPWKDSGSLKRMRHDLLNDDYDYCRKMAPFVGPFPYINESLNPCWYREEDNKLWCVPAIYLAGFSKCGTTDLYSRITQHPQIVLGRVKEFHWFDYLRYFEGQDSIESYAKKFDKFTASIQSDIHRQGYSNKLIGDFTPSYVWSSMFWRCYEGNEGLDEPKYTNADVIHRLNPKAKIIICLRNPVDRLYSRFLTWIGPDIDPAYTKPSPTAFHHLITRAVDMYQACFKTWSPRHCAYNGTMYTLARLRLQEGMYSIFLQDWLRIFPRKQIFIVRFEDYAKDVENHLQSISRFLGIDPFTKSQLESIRKQRQRNKGVHYDIGPMLNKTRRLLQSFYRPFLVPIPDLVGLPNLVW